MTPQTPTSTNHTLPVSVVRRPLNPTLGLSLGCSLAALLSASAFASTHATAPAAPQPLMSTLPKFASAPRFESAKQRALRNAGASIAPKGPIEAPADIARAFGLLRGTAFQLAPAAIGEFGLMHVTVIDPRNGTPLELELRPNSVRTPDFKLIASNSAGQPIEVLPPAPATVRGSVVGVPNALVAGSYLDGNLTLAIILPDGTRINIDPLTLALPNALPGDHIAYTTDDIAEHGGFCGVDHEKDHGHGGIEEQGEGGLADDGGTAGASVWDTQIVIDCDFPFYNRAGGTINTTALRAETIINISNLQYTSEVGIRHLISGLVVRNTAASDPYVGTDLCVAGTELLNQTTTLWTNVQGAPFSSLTRDMVHMFTGRISGGIIGCAWIGDVCANASDYVAHGVSAIDFVPNTGLSTDLFAHEAGHNWGGVHCTCNSPASTMNPILTGANTFQNSPSIATITSWRNAHFGCLDVTGTATDGCGDQLAGSSWIAHPSRFSNDADCCAVVCANDIFCCGTEWDVICANRALSTCVNCGSAGAGSPFVAHATPGCNDFACCAAICAVDAFCCDSSWDALCVNRAEATCRTGDTCAEARLMAPGAGANGYLFNTSEGIVLPDASSCGAGDTRATWRKFVAPCSDWITITACTDFAESQMTLSLWDAVVSSGVSGCGGNELRCSTFVDPTCGTSSVKLQYAVQAGETYFLRISAVNGLNAAGSLSVSCSSVCGGSGSESCTDTHGPGCSNVACCTEVCNFDPYCCETLWDTICVQLARTNCFTAGDLDIDGDVDAADLSLLLSSWGTASGDVDSDGDTDAADLAVLLANWG